MKKDTLSAKFEQYILQRNNKIKRATFNLFINAVKKYCEYNNIQLNYPQSTSPKN